MPCPTRNLCWSAREAWQFWRDDQEIVTLDPLHIVAIKDLTAKKKDARAR